MAKTLHYPFSTSPSLTDIASGVALTCTRATTGTMKDSDGWLREVQSGEARFQGASFSQNLITYSSQFDNAAWTKTACSITADAVADPDGGTAADKIEVDGTTGTHSVKQTTSYGEFAQTHTLTSSAYVKAAEYDIAEIWCLNFSEAVGFGARFELTGATYVSSRVAGSSTILDYGIEDAGNGWYRIWVTGTATNTSVGVHIFPIKTGTATSTVSYTGDSGSGIYVYGAQFEDVSGAWASENLLLQSNQFDTTWTNTRSSETSGQSDPDGGTDAWTLNSDATAANDHYIVQNSALPAPGRYRFSVAMKAANKTWAALVSVGTSAGTIVQYYNLSSGAVGTPDTDAANTGIVSLGGGWYRCWFEMDVDSSDLSGQLQIYPADADGDVTFDGTSTAEIYIYQAQLERTKPSQTAPGTYTATTTAAVTNYSPSTYIPTTTAAVSSLSGSNDGLLVEEARTNICLQSEDFSTTWLNFRTVDTSNQTIAPDGSLTADLITDDGLTGAAEVNIYQDVTVATSTTYTYSAFIKADQLSIAALRLTGFTTPGNSNAWFNLATGVVGTVDAGMDDSGIEDYGNGWYRCWVSFTTDGTDTAGTISIVPCESDGSILSTRDGTSSIFVWGAQLEAGAFPTSYIPTTTGSVTRNGDAISSTDLSWYTLDGPGSMYCHHSGPGVASVGWPFIVFATNNYLGFVRGNGGIVARFTVVDGGAAQVNIDNLISDQEAALRQAAAFDVNDFVHYVDGSAGTPDTSGTLPSAATSLNVGSTFGQYHNGLIKEIAYFNERLPNAVLDSYSTNGLPTLPSGWSYPRDAMPTDETRFHDFISLTGVTTTGDLQGDYRRALANATATSDENKLSINDLAKLFDEQNS